MKGVYIMEENVVTVTETGVITSFIIGVVVGMEHREITLRETGEMRQIAAFGLLSGRTCLPFDIFSSDKMYSKVKDLSDDLAVLAVIRTSVDGRGRLRTYLNGICECPGDLRGDLRAMMNGK